ncbi:MAG: PrsW family intramembrane metalloprotease [Treponema sp.]|jgi:RsiW-degrading membrane proteinase PrsW (M82 family)|nr:PrsW family intramembrane metalloprotease [Treponema sp.]
MKGLWVLLLLIFISALPVFFAFLWYRRQGIFSSPVWFLAALGAGAAAVFTATLLQRFSLVIGVFFPQGGWPGLFFFNVFIHIAFMEELGRFIVFFLFFRLNRRLRTRASFAAGRENLENESPSFGTAAGLVAGLGFAVIESASYGAADFNIALLRAFTAAPLHGACGARIGTAAFTLSKQPGRALFRLLSAVVIHGMYDFIIINPMLPSALSVLIAFAALAASCQEIRRGPPPSSGSSGDRASNNFTPD